MQIMSGLHNASVGRLKPAWTVREQEGEERLRRGREEGKRRGEGEEGSERKGYLFIFI